MTLPERLAAAEAAHAETLVLRDRALAAANTATLDLARLEGQIVLLRELLKPARKESGDDGA